MEDLLLIDAQDDYINRCFLLAGIGQDSIAISFCHLSSAPVILSYDYVLTLGSEVSFIWTAGLRRSSICNLAMISQNIGAFDSKFRRRRRFPCSRIPIRTDLGSCYKLNAAHEILVVTQQFLVGCVLTLRVLAMYSFDKRVIFTLATGATVLLGLGVIPWPDVIVRNIRESHPSPVRALAQIPFLGNAVAWEAHSMDWPGTSYYSGSPSMTGTVAVAVKPLLLELSGWCWGHVFRVQLSPLAGYSLKLIFELFRIICVANLANILVFHVRVLKT
ncbi:hypothetical protein B0H13DRAFT_1875863 [Mycena leptocephala]|nr:hypothetical protein B0H13DRAFT_1875863 [Mycena leptocephala]